jgi:signal transduction histidine kinase
VVDLSSLEMVTGHWQLTRFSDWVRLGGDALIALLLAAAMAGTALAAHGSSLALRVCAVAAAAGLLVLVERRRRPLAVLVAVFATVFVEELVSPNAFGIASFLAVMVAAYSLGAHAPRRVLAFGVGLGAVGVAIGHSLGKPTHYSDTSADGFFFLVLVIGPVLVGRLVRARSQLADRLREATGRLAATRSERVAATLASDRRQLSASVDRALVDGLGRMVKHSQCATRGQVSALEGIARDLLQQMRGLVRDLRDRHEILHPSESVSELRARVRRAIEAGAALPSAPSAAEASPTRWALMSSRVIDAALAIVAVVVAAGVLAGNLGDGALRGPRWVDALLAIAVAAPIACARRFALQATVASVAATFAYAVVAAPADAGSGFLPTGVLLVFPVALGATCPAPRSAFGLLLCLAAIALGDAIDPAAKFNPTTLAPGLALAVGAWAAGRVLRDRGRLLGALADTAVAIEDEREQLGRAALAAERARVARELHDAVAHAMTVIVLQAGAARRVWQADPELAREHTAALRKTVSEVLAELREMIVELKRGEASTAPLEQPIERARASGLRVAVEIHGDRGLLAPALEHTAYRVLQEALTNAARHAPGADVLVRLDFASSGLALEVANDTPPPAANGSGHGLAGMRERVQELGGELTAGEHPAGRFTVRAWLPSP